MKCKTKGCKNRVEREGCKYCEDCMYEALGEEIEKHPIGPSGHRRRV